MTMTAEQSDREIQAVLRAEIRDLQKRHEVEIALLHASYAMAWNGPAKGLPLLELQVDLLTQNHFFDELWYQQAYPHVSDSGMPAAHHYATAGAFAGYNPGPDFDTLAYYFANPDVAEAGWPALVHFLQFGESEGRALA